ncbi:MAG: ABC transporter permease subunit [Microbacteriaceae bacterium]
MIRRSRLAGLLHLWPIVALVLLWDVWVLANGYTSIVAPRPWSVINDVVGNPDAYAIDFLWTLAISVSGLLLGMLLGTIAAVLISLWAPMSAVLTPAALIVRSVPVTVMIPIIARVFGYEVYTVLVVTVITSFFPAFVLGLSGMASAPVSSRDLFVVFGSSRPASLWRLRLPYAVPNLLLALRITAPLAVLSAMLAEFLIGQQGLGYLFIVARSYMEIDRAWGTALVATMLSVFAFLAARFVERRITPRFT